MKDKDAIRVADDLVVVIEEDKLVLRPGNASVFLQATEARHLVDALSQARIGPTMILGSFVV